MSGFPVIHRTEEDYAPEGLERGNQVRGER